MMSDLVETVIVDRDGVAVVINASDFDPETMKLFGVDDAPQDKPRGRPRKGVSDDR